jgi:MFS family permease
MSSIATWFFKRRAFAFGIMAAGSSVGGVIFPIMVQRLIVEVGFGWSMRITGFLVLFMLLIANLTITSRISHKPTPFDVMEFVHPLREVPFDIVAFGCFIFFLGLFLPFNYIILEAIEYGMNPDLAQYLVSILNATSFFGRTIPGYLADKLGRYNMMFVMCAFSGIITLALWLPAKANAPIIVFVALFGFSSGAFVSLAPSLIAQISDVKKIGVRTGTLFAVISIAALICQPIGGALVTRWHGSYTGLQIYAGVMMCG